MLAFIDSPIALIALAVIILIMFGPNKVPEIFGQLGRALGELKRATNGFQQSLKMGENESNYTPSNYDSYYNASDYSSSNTEYNSSASVSEEDLHRSGSDHSVAASQPPHSDFAASALADTGDEYTYTSPTPAPASSAPKPVEAAREITPRPAESTVPRNS